MARLAGQASAMLRLRRISEPEPDHLTVRHGDDVFAVELRRRAGALKLTLRVSAATGRIVATIPPRARLSSVQPFLEAHAGWIAARLARLPERVPFTPGAVLPLRDQPHRIVHGSRVRSATRATTDDTGEAVIAVAGDVDAVPGRVARFLAAEAASDLGEAVARHAARLGVAAGRVTVRDTTSRWGSCSSTGALSFSWRLILAPAFVLDYLAAHEVAHLRELNHSQRFWRSVHDLCPRTEEAERWLKRHGSGLHRFG